MPLTWSSKRSTSQSATTYSISDTVAHSCKPGNQIVRDRPPYRKDIQKLKLPKLGSQIGVFPEATSDVRDSRVIHMGDVAQLMARRPYKFLNTACASRNSHAYKLTFLSSQRGIQLEPSRKWDFWRSAHSRAL